MGSTGPIESWNAYPPDIGPMYPFLGWEMLMFAISVAFCVAFMVWKFKTENAKYAARASQLRESGELSKGLANQNTTQPG